MFTVLSGVLVCLRQRRLACVVVIVIIGRRRTARHWPDNLSSCELTSFGAALRTLTCEVQA